MYEKTTQIPDFFVETLIAGDESDSEVGDLPEIMCFNNTEELPSLPFDDQYQRT